MRSDDILDFYTKWQNASESKRRIAFRYLPEGRHVPTEKMKALKTRGLISGYDEETGSFTGHIRTGDRGYFTALMGYVGEKEWKFEFGKYFRRPSTGDDSQFHHYWGHLQQVADEFGENIKALDWLCRNSAMDVGFPFDIAAGQPVPWSLSDERVDVKHMGTLVDHTHDFVSMNYPGFELYEGDHDDREETGDASLFEQKIQRMLRDSQK